MSRGRGSKDQRPTVGTAISGSKGGDDSGSYYSKAQAKTKREKGRIPSAHSVVAWVSGHCRKRGRTPNRKGAYSKQRVGKNGDWTVALVLQGWL